uniref:NADH-ubiquinone oxidoreductase chain 2 n=1 Tax=Eupristina koningsbergeri TaxID=318089 RepID=A0A8A3YD08_9HYME|nr:NADH dehydrogenase subunit 2 [Eupristina koningsbergeri]
MYLNYYIWVFFTPIMLISNFLALMMTSWFSLWVLMEINTLCFIFIMAIKAAKKYILIDYFLTQCLCSLIYLFSYFSFFSHLSEYMIIPMLLAVLTKLGIPPFHMWYSKMFYDLDWMSIYFLSVLQKIIPLIVMNMMINLMFYNLNHSLILHLVVSIIWCGMMGLVENRLKLINVYSSIINISWIILMMFISDLAALIYFILYSIVSFNLIYICNNYNLLNIQDFSIMKVKNIYSYYFILLVFFSLGGLPPFFGFMMKWVTFSELTNMVSFNCLVIYVFASLISLGFYIRNIYMILTLSSIKIKNFSWINLDKSKSFSNDYNLYLISMILFFSIFIYEIL